MSSSGDRSSPILSDAEDVSEYEDLRSALFKALDRICHGVHSVPREQAENADIARILKAWRSLSEQEDSEARRPFIYSLAEEEREGPLSLSELEGRAEAVTKRVMNLGVSVPGFDLFLAILEKETIGDRSGDYEDEYNFRRRDEYGYDEDGEEESDEEPEPLGRSEMGEIQEVNYHLEGVYDLISGKRLGEFKHLDEDQILQDLDDYFEGEPDENYDEDMDYYSQPITYYHRRPALVIVPERATLKFLSSTSPSELLPWYSNICLSRAARPSYLAAFNELCRSVVQPSRGASYHAFPSSRDNLLAKMVQVTLLHRQYDSLDYILKNNNDPLPLGFFTGLATHIDPKEMPWSKLQKRLRASFNSTRSLTQRYEILEELDTLVNTSDDLKACIARAVDDLLLYLNFLEQIDVGKTSGEVFYRVALQFKGFGYIKTKLVTILKACSYRTAFMLGFLRLLRRSMNRHEVPWDEALQVYKTLADWTIESMNGSIMTARPQASASDLPGGSAQKPPPSKKRVERVKPDTFGAFIDSLYEYKFEELRTKLFELLIRDKKAIPGSEYNPLYIPLLQGLLVSIEKHKVPLLQTAHQAVFQNLLWCYIQSYVRKEPLANKWACSTVVGCQCNDCRLMNVFLGDGNREVGYFRVPEYRRRHLLDHLEQIKLDFTSYVDRTNTPSTLIITKVDQKQLTEKWAERRLKAEDNISAFDQEKLKGLLQHWYVEITTMRMLAEVERPQQHTNHGSVYSRSLGYLHDPSPFPGGSSSSRASPAIPASSVVPAGPAPTFSPAEATDELPQSDIRNRFIRTKPSKRTEAQDPELYSAFTFQSSSRRLQEPLAERLENVDEKLARLQKTVSRGGSQSSSSQKAQSASRPSAGVKRKATEVIDLTLDSD